MKKKEKKGTKGRDLDLEFFKKKLMDLRDQISHTIQGTTEQVKETEESRGYSQHQADEGTDDFGKTISIEVSSQEYNILKQIERALEKIEDGTYGICDISGKDISKERLEAVPYATMTVEAQEMLEKGLL
jgi:DnaK suppressor protein